VPAQMNDRRRWALLFVLAGNMLIDSLEVSTLVVATPSISRSLRVAPAVSSLFMIGFAASFGVAVLAGQIVRTRRKRLYLAALLVFAGASLGSGLAANAPELIAARVVKGVCVALLAPTGLAIISSVFPEGPSRRRAVSVYSLFGAGGFSAGLILSGALTIISWRWTLLVSGPAALALFPFALAVIPADVRIARSASAPLPTPVPADARAAATVSYRPLIRPAVGAAALNGSYWGFLFVATFSLQGAARWSPLAAGLALLPTSMPLAITVLSAGRLFRRIGPGALVATGSLASLAGYAYYLATGVHTAYLTGLLPATAAVGIAFMLSFSALNLMAAGRAPTDRRTAAIAIYQMSVQLGGALILAITSALSAVGPRQAMSVVTAFAAAGLLVAVGGMVADSRRR
jgi:predicted MFS family arabinose efflux permease